MTGRVTIDAQLERGVADVIVRVGIPTNPPLSAGTRAYIARVVWDRPPGSATRRGRFGRGTYLSGLQFARGRAAALVYRVVY